MLPLIPRHTGSPLRSMKSGNGPRGLIPIRWPPLIVTRSRKGGRGMMPRGYTTALRRKRDKGTEYSARFKDYGETRAILVEGWRILEYGGIRGGDWSHTTLKSCGADSSHSRGNQGGQIGSRRQGGTDR